MIYYFPGFPPTIGGSNWERVKIPSNNDVLYPKEFANTNVVVGDNTDVTPIFSNPLQLRVVGNSIIETTKGFLYAGENFSTPGTEIIGASIDNGTSQLSLQINEDNSAIQQSVTDGNTSAQIQLDLTNIGIVFDDIVNNRQSLRNQNSNAIVETLNDLINVITKTIAIDLVNEITIQSTDTPNNYQSTIIVGNDKISLVVFDSTITHQVVLDNLGVKLTNDVAGSEAPTLKPSGRWNILYPAYDDDAAAGAAGLVAGDHYQTTGAGAAPLNVAGIVMVKQ